MPLGAGGPEYGPPGAYPPLRLPLHFLGQRVPADPFPLITARLSAARARSGKETPLHLVNSVRCFSPRKANGFLFLQTILTCSAQQGSHPHPRKLSCISVSRSCCLWGKSRGTDGRRLRWPLKPACPSRAPVPHTRVLSSCPQPTTASS